MFDILLGTQKLLRTNDEIVWLQSRLATWYAYRHLPNQKAPKAPMGEEQHAPSFICDAYGEQIDPSPRARHIKSQLSAEAQHKAT